MRTCTVRTFSTFGTTLFGTNITLFHVKTLNGKDANESVNVSREASSLPYHK